MTLTQTVVLPQRLQEEIVDQQLRLTLEAGEAREHNSSPLWESGDICSRWRVLVDCAVTGMSGDDQRVWPAASVVLGEC